MAVDMSASTRQDATGLQGPPPPADERLGDL